MGLNPLAKLFSKIDQRYPGWVCEGREIFDQDEDGKIADHEVR